MEMEEVCQLPQPKDILFPEYRTNTDTHILCNKLKGHLSVANTRDKMNLLIDKFKRHMPEAFQGYQSCMLVYNCNSVLICRC